MWLAIRFYIVSIVKLIFGPSPVWVEQFQPLAMTILPASSMVPCTYLEALKTNRSNISMISTSLISRLSNGAKSIPLLVFNFYLVLQRWFDFVFFQGEKPTHRAFHSATAINNRMYIFGGFSGRYHDGPDHNNTGVLYTRYIIAFSYTFKANSHFKHEMLLIFNSQLFVTRWSTWILKRQTGSTLLWMDSALDFERPIQPVSFISNEFCL